MSQNSNLNILMQKLYAMEKKLGVNSGPKGNFSVPHLTILDKKKDTDEFNQTQIEALELLDYIKKKQDERDQKIQKLGNNPETLRLAAEIKDKIAELEKLVEKLNEAVRKQIKNPKVQGHKVCNFRNFRKPRPMENKSNTQNLFKFSRTSEVVSRA